MSKKHSEEILALAGVLYTDSGRSHAFSYLLGILSAKAEVGKPVSATALVKAVVDAIESASKASAERSAREREQAWRVAEEAELPEPRKVPAPVIPGLGMAGFSHAMTDIGETNAWCGAPGPVVVFSAAVTCPACQTMLLQEEAGDLEARARRAGSPLADDTSASDKPAQIEIVIGEVSYSDAELDGLACVECRETFAVGERSVPAGVVDGGPMVFAHRRCIIPPRVDDGGALNDAGRDYAEETAQRAESEREGQEELAGEGQEREPLETVPEVPVRPWMACADCFSPDSCYSGDMDCP